MNVFRWWGDWQSLEPTDGLSILDLIRAGSLDLRLASLLWLMMEHRASVLVAAVPSSAGKTTTLNALLDFLHPEVKQIYLQGGSEDFGFLKNAEPANTYMVAAEFSDHLGAYVWGDVAKRAFELLLQGYALGGTMHARTVKEVVDILHEDLGLPLPLIARLGAVITLSVMPSLTYDAESVRRVDVVSLLGPENDGVSIEVIASRVSKGATFDIAGEEVLQAALSTRFGIDSGLIAAEMETRKKFLGQLLKEGKHSRDEVREAAIEFHKSRHY